MAFATSVAKAKSRGHDIRRKLFLKRSASGEQARLRLYGPTGLIGEVARGWNLELRERQEIATGARYFNLFVDLIDDPEGELLSALKTATKVKIGSVDFGFLTKPSFLTAVPSYTFRVQPIGQS